jgi:hypothetical protein
MKFTRGARYFSTNALTAVASLSFASFISVQIVVSKLILTLIYFINPDCVRQGFSVKECFVAFQARERLKLQPDNYRMLAVA